MSKKNTDNVKTYDVLVIGSGPGGYVCALELAQFGLSVACIDENPTPGGTCLNVGCIPSKSLLHASHLYEKMEKNVEGFGIKVKNVSFDLSKMMAFKDQVVLDNTKGVSFLLKKASVTFINGRASFQDARTLRVISGMQDKIIQATKGIVIATGSNPVGMVQYPFDGKKILSSTHALALKSVPSSMMIVGGGYIGLEMGSLWARLGTKVTVIEMGEHIVQGMDLEISGKLKQLLKQQGLTILTQATIKEMKRSRSQMHVSVLHKGENLLLTASVVLVAVGRKPATQILNLKSLPITTDKYGYISVDDDGCTNVKGVYAIGDVCGSPLLAHKASMEAKIVAHVIAGKTPPIKTFIPGVIYTHPEVASVGETEEQIVKQGKSFRKGIFPLMASGRAKSMGEKHGLCKILVAEDDRLLGAHIMAPNAGEMIMECATAMAFGGSGEDLSTICHPHPTLSESLAEAATIAWKGKTTHL